MVMPVPAYMEALLRACYHVQVELEQPAVVGQTPARIAVSGWVGRVFRGDGALQPGDPVRFRVAVCRPGDPIPPGGDRWMDLEDFERARYLEVFLDGVPPECEVAGSGRYAIKGLTHAPYVSAPTAEEVAAACNGRFGMIPPPSLHPNPESFIVMR